MGLKGGMSHTSFNPTLSWLQLPLTPPRDKWIRLQVEFLYKHQQIKVDFSNYLHQLSCYILYQNQPISFFLLFHRPVRFGSSTCINQSSTCINQLGLIPQTAASTNQVCLLNLHQPIMSDSSTCINQSGLIPQPLIPQTASSNNIWFLNLHQPIRSDSSTYSINQSGMIT